MNKTILGLALLFLTSIFVSCEKEEADTTPPVIQISAPEDDKVLIIGNEIHFEADFSDAGGLKSYKIDIHDNLNGHNHKSSKGSVAWSYQKSWDFVAGAKNAHIHHHDIKIPITVGSDSLSPGSYHFMIYCTDVSGNENWLAVDVVLAYSGDTVAPVFSGLTGPSAQQEFSTGQTISLGGMVSDNDMLHALWVFLLPEGTDPEQANQEESIVVLYAHEELEGLSSSAFSGSINIGQVLDQGETPKPVTWAAGAYFLIAKAVDESGNVVYSPPFPVILQ